MAELRELPMAELKLDTRSAEKLRPEYQIG